MDITWLYRHKGQGFEKIPAAIVSKDTYTTLLRLKLEGKGIIPEISHEDTLPSGIVFWADTIIGRLTNEHVHTNGDTFKYDLIPHGSAAINQYEQSEYSKFEMVERDGEILFAKEDVSGVFDPSKWALCRTGMVVKDFFAYDEANFSGRVDDDAHGIFIWFRDVDVPEKPLSEDELIVEPDFLIFPMENPELLPAQDDPVILSRATFQTTLSEGQTPPDSSAVYLTREGLQYNNGTSIPYSPADADGVVVADYRQGTYGILMGGVIIKPDNHLAVLGRCDWLKASSTELTGVAYPEQGNEYKQVTNLNKQLIDLEFTPFVPFPEKEGFLKVMTADIEMSFVDIAYTIGNYIPGDPIEYTVALVSVDSAGNLVRLVTAPGSPSESGFGILRKWSLNPADQDFGLSAGETLYLSLFHVFVGADDEFYREYHTVSWDDTSDDAIQIGNVGEAVTPLGTNPGMARAIARFNPV